MLVAAFIVALTGLTLVEALPSPSSSKSYSQSQSSKLHLNWASTRHLLAFGDSYTYVQGTAGYPNYSFIGDELNFAYDARTLLSDEIVQNQTGTSAGGPNWLQYLTGCGLDHGLTRPVDCEIQLWDFAFAGAGVSEELIPLHHPFTTSFVRQIEQFTTYGHPILTSPSVHPDRRGQAILNPSETLTAIWIGINDVNDSASYNLTTSGFKDFYTTLQTTLFSALQTLTALGYKDYLLLNLPPLHRTPSNQVRVSQGQEPTPSQQQVELWNDLLVQQALLFEDQNPGVNALVFDAYTALNTVLDHPARYGIVNTTDVCEGAKQPDIYWAYESYGCPTPIETYFWYDSGHITSSVHGILSGMLMGALRGGL